MYSTLVDVWDGCTMYTPEQYVYMLNEFMDTHTKQKITCTDLAVASTEHTLQRLLRNAENACRGDTSE